MLALRIQRSPGSSVGYALVYWSSGPSSIPARGEMFSTVNGAPLHTVFHYQPSIVLIWQKHCWKGRKIPCHPSSIAHTNPKSFRAWCFTVLKNIVHHRNEILLLCKCRRNVAFRNGICSSEEICEALYNQSNFICFGKISNYWSGVFFFFSLVFSVFLCFSLVTIWVVNAPDGANGSIKLWAVHSCSNLLIYSIANPTTLTFPTYSRQG